MRKRRQYLAGFLEKISVAFLIAAVVRDNTLVERVIFFLFAIAALATGYYLTDEEDGDEL